jgi:hypothetical protein
MNRGRPGEVQKIKVVKHPIATDDGTLICIEAGDAKADGWAMRGGSAQHNGPSSAK